MPDKVVQVGDKVISFPSTMSDDDISQAISSQYRSLQSQGSQESQQPSAMPGLPNFLHAVGLPGSMDEARAMAANQQQHPIRTAWDRIKPVLTGGLGGQIVTSMAKEGGRAAQGIWEHGGIPQPMDAVHAASAVDPFAAPVVDAMTQQGLGSADANATGILGAASLTTGLGAGRGPQIGQTAKILARPAGKMALEAARDIPIVRGVLKGAETFKDVPGQLRDVWNPPPEGGPGQPPPAQPQAQPVAQSPQASPIPQSPAPESPPVQSPANAGLYGKYSGKSNLKGNQRQLAGPTSSTSPNPSTPTPQAAHPPEIMKILQKPGEISDADMNTLQNYFAKQRLSNLLSGGAAQGTVPFSLADMLTRAVQR